MATIIFAAAASNAVYGLLCLVGFLIFAVLFMAGTLYLRRRRRGAALGQVQMQDTAEASEELDRLREEDEEEEGEGGQGLIQTKGPFGLTYDVKEVPEP